MMGKEMENGRKNKQDWISVGDSLDKLKGKVAQAVSKISETTHFKKGIV